MSKLLGKEGPSSPKAVHLDLHRLESELIGLHATRLKLARTLTGPLRVRTAEVGIPDNLGKHIVLEDGKVTLQGKTIPNIWLRDNCQCSSCVHESTKQRLQDTFAIPKDLSIKGASYTRDKDALKTHISIEWSDGHKSTYTQPFLYNAIASVQEKSTIRQGWVAPRLWTAELAQNPYHLPSVPYYQAVENIGPVLNLIVRRMPPMPCTTAQY